MRIRIRDNGKVQYIEEYTDFYSGKRKTVSMLYDKDTPKNRRQAQQILFDKINDLSIPNPTDITFGQLVDEYNKDRIKEVRQTTYLRNFHTMEIMKKILGADTLVNKLTARYIRMRLLESGKSHKTLNEYLIRLKTLFNWANASEVIDMPGLANKLIPFSPDYDRTSINSKYLESYELKEVLATTEQETWRLYYEFLALSGLRPGEGIALAKEDIDLDARVIHINKTYNSRLKKVFPAKTINSNDDISIQNQLLICIKQINVAMLKQSIRCGYKTDLFFSDITGNHINYFSANKYFKKESMKLFL